MNTTLTPYYFNSRPVRSLTDESGNPWFVAKDVCDILEIQQPTKAVGSLDDDEVNKSHLVDSIGKNQEMLIISESGLYTLIIRSNKPEAKAFRKWVTSEVLPSIRKTGAYATPQEPPKVEESCKPFSERSKLAALFFKNVDRLYDDLCDIPIRLVERGDVPASLLLICMNVVTQADVCRDIAKLFFEKTK